MNIFYCSAPCAGVNVPVEDVCRRTCTHGAVGDELHMGVECLDGKVEGDVVAHIRRMAAVLASTKLIESPVRVAVPRGNASADHAVLITLFPLLSSNLCMHAQQLQCSTVQR